MLVGCDLGIDPPAPPPVHIVSSIPSVRDGGLALHPIGPPLVVTFDRLLAPSTVHTGSVLVRSNVFGVFGGVRYDPARRAVTFTPDLRALRRPLQYELIVTGALRAWDGGALAAPLTLRFTLGADAPPPPRPIPSLQRDVAPLFATRCATAHCHGGTQPAMGLDLSSPAAIRRSTLRVPARQRPAPGPGTTLTAGDPAWGGLVLIDPGFVTGTGRPEYSYLLYKLLGDGPILGARMPPEGPALTPDELARVSDWIAAGTPD